MSLRPGPVIVACLTAGLSAIASLPLGAQVAARRIARGTVLTAEDIVVSTAAPGTAAPGWIAHRVIQPGESLTTPAVAPPPLIRAGQAVQFVVERSGIQLSLQGIALADASSGDTIEVRIDPRRRMRGVVSGPGRLTAAFPVPR